MNKKKYFVVSDIHSYFMPLKNSLWSAGFRRTNKDHILIICGDLFDRGENSLAVYEYISSLPKNRVILIRGNHELLLFELLEKKFPDAYDFSNGTVSTCCQVARLSESLLNKYFYLEQYLSNPTIAVDWEKASLEIEKQLLKAWKKIKTLVKKSSFYQWLQSSQWRDFYELDNFIFVHSFIPTKAENQYYNAYNSNPQLLKFFSNWRTEATKLELEDAKWGCPFKLYKYGLFDEEIKNNKILVCGHWRADEAHEFFGTEGYKDNFDIFYSDHLIMLDACTAYTRKTNVLVIEDGICYDQYRHKLGE